jgi:hypothetical protein
MSNERDETNEEIDCLVTVNDGAYMTCDMIEEKSSENEKVDAMKSRKSETFKH